MTNKPGSIDGGLGSGDIPVESEADTGNQLSPQLGVVTMAEASEIWTAAAMRDAIPVDVIEVDEDAIAAMEYAPTEGEADGLISGGQPENEDEPAPESGEDVDLLGYGYPAPFTRWENFDSYTKGVYATVGKLFFKQDGKSYVGSAASVGGCAIITAGHCVHEGNNSAQGWVTDAVFVPAYRDGAAPFGVWPANYLVTRNQWFKNGISKGLSEDIGGAVLHKQGGKSISQRVGWLGLMWNWSRDQHWLSMGYPAAAPFNGQRQWINAASYAYNGNVGASPAPVGMGNDLTGGCSGGPWVARFGSGNYVNGINSYRNSSKPNELFSPYFGNAAKSLFDELMKGKC